MDLVFRPATDADLPAVKQTLYLALSWNPDDPIPPFEEVVDHPEMAIYHDGWMRPGDAGVVAETDGEFVGMAYYRLFSTDVPGQGFVDADTPELAIAVIPAHRGRGVGTGLLRELHSMARSAGVVRISLSVSAGNPARRLYERHGYEPRGRDNDELMTVTL